jgi:hypothetical protein
MTTITEIAPDIFRINTFISDFNLGFSQFLVRDDEPLLFHTGMRGIFPIVHEAVGKLIDASSLRWVCSCAAGGMRSPSEAIGTSHTVSPLAGCVTAVMPKFVGSPSSMETQVTPSSSER